MRILPNSWSRLYRYRKRPDTGEPLGPNEAIMGARFEGEPMPEAPMLLRAAWKADRQHTNDAPDRWETSKTFAFVGIRDGWVQAWVKWEEE